MRSFSRGARFFDGIRRRIVVLVHGSNTLGYWQQHWEEHLQGNAEGVTIRRIAFAPTQLWKVVLSPFAKTRRTREIGSQIFDIIDELKADDQVSIVAHSYGTALLVSWLRSNRGTKFKNVVLLGSIVRRKRFAALSARADNIFNIVATSDEVVCAAEAYGLGLYEATGAFGVRQHVRNLTDYFVEGDHATIVTVAFLDEVVLPIVLVARYRRRPMPPARSPACVGHAAGFMASALFVFLRPAATKTEAAPTNAKSPSAQPPAEDAKAVSPEPPPDLLTSPERAGLGTTRAPP